MMTKIDGQQNAIDMLKEEGAKTTSTTTMKNPPTIFNVGHTFHARGINRINIVTFSVSLYTCLYCTYC